MMLRLRSAAERVIEIVYLVIIMVAFLLVVTVARDASGAGLVNLFERQFGGGPGAIRVIPECGCTMKYVGTRIEGADYFVHFKKLD